MILLFILGTIAAVALAQSSRGTSQGRSMGNVAAVAGAVAVVIWLLTVMSGKH